MPIARLVEADLGVARRSFSLLGAKTAPRSRARPPASAGPMRFVREQSVEEAPDPHPAVVVRRSVEVVPPAMGEAVMNAGVDDDLEWMLAGIPRGSRTQLIDMGPRNVRVELRKEGEDRTTPREQRIERMLGMAIVQDLGPELAIPAHDRREPVAMGGSQVGAGSAPAVSDRPDRSAAHRRMIREEVDRRLDVADDLAVRHSAYEVLQIRERDVRGGSLAAVEVDGQRRITHPGELVNHAADVIAESPRIVEDDDARVRTPSGATNDPRIRSPPESSSTSMAAHSISPSTVAGRDPVNRGAARHAIRDLRFVHRS